jgi:hypothetical protein
MQGCTRHLEVAAAAAAAAALPTARMRLRHAAPTRSSAPTLGRGAKTTQQPPRRGLSRRARAARRCTCGTVHDTCGVGRQHPAFMQARPRSRKPLRHHAAADGSSHNSTASSCTGALTKQSSAPPQQHATAGAAGTPSLSLALLSCALAATEVTASQRRVHREAAAATRCVAGAARGSQPAKL